MDERFLKKEKPISPEKVSAIKKIVAERLSFLLEKELRLSAGSLQMLKGYLVYFILRLLPPDVDFNDIAQEIDEAIKDLPSQESEIQKFMDKLINDLVIILAQYVTMTLPELEYEVGKFFTEETAKRLD